MGELGGFEQQLVRLFDSAAVVPVALVAALAVGAAHGLAPGHGKTLAVAYLVGSGARRRQAVALAVIVAAMHTVSVLALGLFWWFAVGGGAVPVERTTGWMQLLAAVAVLAVGVALTRRRWRERGTPHHSHRPPGDATPLSRAGLTGIASAGGLLPSPSAFIVLISGLLTGRVGLALGMVAMFGAGLAATVLAAGLLTIAGRDWIAGRSATRTRLWSLMQYLPLVGATGVVMGGCLLGIVAVNGLLSA